MIRATLDAWMLALAKWIEGHPTAAWVLLVFVLAPLFVGLLVQTWSQILSHLFSRKRDREKREEEEKAKADTKARERREVAQALLADWHRIDNGVALAFRADAPDRVPLDVWQTYKPKVVESFGSQALPLLQFFEQVERMQGDHVPLNSKAVLLLGRDRAEARRRPAISAGSLQYLRHLMGEAKKALDEAAE